jgi:hypothetical protein
MRLPLGRPVAVPADPRLPRSEPPQPLWQPASEAAYGGLYRQHLFDQYKLAVEMADRVSARRMQANTFFLAVNTGLLTVFATLVKDKTLSGFSGTLPIAALVALCFVWWRIVQSYRQLNSGKYDVILAIEALLPLAPYATEWEALGRGEDPKRYLPLTHVENWVPKLFGLLYLLLFVAVLMGDKLPELVLGG